MSIQFPILYRVSLSSLVSIQFSYMVQSQSQQSGVNPVSLYCSQSQQSGVNPVSYIVQSVSAVWCQSSFPIWYRVSLSSLVSILFPYIVVSLSSLVSILFPYIVVSLSSLVSIQFPILYRVSLSSLVSIKFSYIVQSRSQQSGVNPVSYIVQSQSQQSGVNPVFLYGTESVSAVWCQSCFPIL